MVEQLAVGRELHHLGVDEHKLELRRMLGVQQRSHYHIESHRLTLLCSTGYQKVRGIGQVKDLDLLRNGIAYGYGQFGLALAEGGIVQERLQRHYRRRVVGHFDTHRVGEGNHPHSPGIQRHGYIVLKVLYGRNLHSGGRIDLVQGDRGAHNGLHVHHLDLVVGEGSPYLVVVAYQFLL